MICLTYFEIYKLGKMAYKTDLQLSYLKLGQVYNCPSCRIPPPPNPYYKKFVLNMTVI